MRKSASPSVHDENKFFGTFPDETSARTYLELARWPGGVRCVHCGSDGAYSVRHGRGYACKACRRQFSVRTGTVMEGSHISLRNWLYAMYLLSASKGSLTSVSLAKVLGITQKSAWLLLDRIRDALIRGGLLDQRGGREQDFPSFPAIARFVAAPIHPPSYLLGLNRFVDMFCGIGGFHLAASTLGMKCVFACDVDEEVRRAYKHNYGIIPAGDITKIRASDVPDHDVFFAGFPCQPFSIIGKRKGFDDIRGTLFFEIVRILKEKRPRAVLLENVKQLSTNDKGRTIKRIVESLKELGYFVDWTILNALDFGLPQKRERVLIAATLDPFEIFPWPQGGKPMKPLKEILEEDPDPQHFVSERIRKLRQEKHKSKYSPGIWHENKAGNVTSYPYSCALRAGASYNYLLVDGVRRLTPREMLRLQGFPDSFEDVCSLSQTRKQTGNAVPVPLALAGMEGILSVIAAAEASGRRTRAQGAVSVGRVS